MKLQQQLILGYTLMFLLIASLAYFSLGAISNQSETSSWVAHTEKVIAKIHNIEKELIDLETGQRGFLVSGEDLFLEPYNDALTSYQIKIEDLKKTVSDNPSQVLMLDNLEKMTEDWVEEVAKPEIELRKKVSEADIYAQQLQDILEKETGKTIFDEMRIVMDEIIMKFRIDGNLQGEKVTKYIEKAMVDQETGQRGFLITGKESFLEPYHQGKDNLKLHLKELNKLVENTHDRVEVETKLVKINKLMEKWDNTIAKPKIALRKEVNEGKKDLKVLTNLVREAHGKNTLDEIRSVMDQIKKQFIKASNQLGQTYITQIAKSIVDKETGLRGYIITGDEKFLEPYEIGEEKLKEYILKLDKLNKNTYNLIAMKSALQNLERLSLKWSEKSALPEINLRRKMNENKYSMADITSTLKKGKGRRLMDNMRKHINKFISNEQELLYIREKKSNETIKFSRIIINSTVSIGLILGLIITFVSVKSVTSQVGRDPGEIARITRQVSKGDLNVQFNDKHSQDRGILASIKTMVHSLQENEKLRDTQEWLQIGIANLNESLRANNQTKSKQNTFNLSQTYIDSICNYTHAQIGTVCIKDDERNNTLILSGSYAYTKRKNLSNEFKIGQGLIGQAARERRQLVISQVPNDYITINSSTGEKTPSYLVLTPIISNDELIGMTEVGYFEEPTETVLNYLKQTSDIAGNNIKIMKNQEEIVHALAHSEKLSENLRVQQEELQEQSEELKVSNEELEEQTRLLKEREEKLENQQEELRQTNEELEEQSKALNKEKHRTDIINQELERNREHLEEQSEKLKQSNQYKSEFLANMSHELRTPMNSMLLLSKMLMENKAGNLTEREVEFAHTINRSGKDLLEIINDILDLSKIEAGKMTYQFENTPISSIIEKLKATYEPLANEKQLDFITSISPDIPKMILTDSQRCEQVLKNFISNAIKFTKEGAISIKAQRPTIEMIEARLINSHIAFSVEDTGLGIPKEMQDKIFSAFQQADGSTSRQYGGTGLGLSISKELSSALNGKIHLSSQKGVGSAFTIILPEKNKQSEDTNDHIENEAAVEPLEIKQDITHLTRVSEIIPPVDGGPQLAKTSDDRLLITENDKCILIIEDDEDFVNVLVEQIHQKEFKVLIANDGEAGLHLAFHYQPNAILLDLGLPGIGGYEVLKRIKNNHSLRHIPIHILSGDEKNNHSIKLGAVDHITKPINLEEVSNMIEKIEQFILRTVKNCIIIDDNPEQAKELSLLLKNNVNHIELSSSSEDALQELNRNHYDCCVLDYHLDQSSQGSLIEKIKKQPKLKNLPIIVYTGGDNTYSENHFFNNLDKELVLKKAENPQELLNEVTLFMHSLRDELSTEQKSILDQVQFTSDVFNDTRVLLVDDDVRNLFALTSVLEEKGCHVSVAKNGKEAVEIIQNEEKFKIILMDIMMPEMDGYEAISIIRDQSDYKKTPILALTAKAMKGDRLKCMNAGASDYLSKPIDTDKLFSMMRVWLS